MNRQPNQVIGESSAARRDESPIGVLFDPSSDSLESKSIKQRFFRPLFRCLIDIQILNP
jgi:hypothetical protein